MTRRRIKSNIYRGETRQPFRQNIQVGTIQEEYFQFEEAVVVDVVVNDDRLIFLPRQNEHFRIPVSLQPAASFLRPQCRGPTLEASFCLAAT